MLSPCRPPIVSTALRPLPPAPPPFLFRWSLLLGTALGSTTLILVSGLNKELGISDHTFMLSDSVMLTVLGQVRSS